MKTTKTNRTNRTEAELARLAEIFADLPEEKLAVALPLIENASFMKIALEDLQEQIQAEGPVEIYTNGANQSGKKQSAAMQAYNATMKVYASVIKTLSAMVPAQKRATLPTWKKPEETETPEEARARLEKENKEMIESLRAWELHRERVAAGLEEETEEEKADRAEREKRQREFAEAMERYNLDRTARQAGFGFSARTDEE